MRYMDIPIAALIHRDIKKDFKNLGIAIDQILSDNESLKSRVCEFNKDNEIKAKDAELQSVYDHALCVMSDKESNARREFVEQHYKTCGNSGTFIYELSGTGIGTVIKIKCPICSEEKDITDIDSW